MKNTIGQIFWYSILSVCLISFTLPSFAQEKTPRAYRKYIKKHRKNYKKDFLKSERSPLDRKGTKKLDFYQADINYKVQGTFKRTPKEKPFDLMTSSGRTRKYVKYGEVTLPVNGQSITLAVYQSLRALKMPMYRDHLFIPFKDATNNKTTYGGGRYLDAKLTDIVEEKMTIDFNKAYNPYCAFKPEGYSCPIPPKENHLQISIEAGEKNFEK